MGRVIEHTFRMPAAIMSNAELHSVCLPHYSMTSTLRSSSHAHSLVIVRTLFLFLPMLANFPANVTGQAIDYNTEL